MHNAIENIREAAPELTAYCAATGPTSGRIDEAPIAGASGLDGVAALDVAVVVEGNVVSGFIATPRRLGMVTPRSSGR